MEESLKIVGLMSGTSLDGVDIALCNFRKTKDLYDFEIIKAETIPYSEIWKNRLKNAHNLSGFNFILLHKEYGEFLAKLVKQFIEKNGENAKFIASHGHTIFHQPEKNITFQIGDGSVIAAKTGISTISDFRTLDVSHGGQGAPLVPIGDELLFAEYDFCINLGGFANISYRYNNQRIAFDICPANIAINFLASQINLPFDEDGRIAKSGEINFDMLKKLNFLAYYSQKPPKSLGREWFESEFLPIIDTSSISIENRLRTVYEHIVIQIVKTFNDKFGEKILISGGGAHNNFLIDLLQQKTEKEIVVPEKDIIDYKEALIFAFLGLLRVRNETNCLSSVTGAKSDNCGGIVHQII